MARPAPNTPQDSNGYGDDDSDEPEGERVTPSTPKRAAPPPKAKSGKSRQWRDDGPAEPRKTAWNDNDAEPVAMDYDAPVPGGEPVPPARSGKPGRAAKTVPPFAPSEEAAMAETFEAASPAPDLTTDQPALESLAPESPAPKVRRGPAPRDYDWAGAVYLALLAILVACLSAAVVLFLF
jgi:hypothetical protein